MHILASAGAKPESRGRAVVGAEGEADTAGDGSAGAGAASSVAAVTAGSDVMY